MNAIRQLICALQMLLVTIRSVYTHASVLTDIQEMELIAQVSDNGDLILVQTLLHFTTVW